MVLGTIGTALAVGAATQGGSMLASKFLGGGSSGGGGGGGFTPPGFAAGGLSAKFNSGKFKVKSSKQRQGLVGGLSQTFPEQARLIAEQRAQVAPGFGRLTSSRLQEVENARQRSIGNLRENLASRRVLGSSFAGDAQVRAEKEFAQEAEKAQAESFLQELELTNELINQEFDTARGEFTTQIGEMNLQAELAAKLTSGATGVLSQAQQFAQEMNAKSAAGAGQLFGKAFGPAFSAIGNSFGGGGNGAGFAQSAFQNGGVIS